MINKQIRCLTNIQNIFYKKKDNKPYSVIFRANSHFDVLGRGEDGERGFVDVMYSREVERDSVEKEVGVSSSVVDADEALEVLVESLRLGVALPAVEVPQNGGGI